MQRGKEVTRKEQRDAEEAAAREAAKLHTFRQYVSGVYLPTKRIEISENAYSCYEQMLRCHMLPEFGDFLLEEITPAMVSAFLLKMQQSGLSHETVIKLYNITNGVFKMAYLDETLRENPMLKMQRPRQSKEAKTEGVKAYTADEIRYILRCLENEPLQWRCYVVMLIQTGCRRGEACALRWSDVDFETGAVTISQNLQYTAAAGVYFCTPKNGKSRTGLCRLGFVCAPAPP